MLNPKRLRPIPWTEDAPTALDYHGMPVDLTDPRAREPLVDLADYGIAGTGFYARDDGLNAPYERAFASANRRVRTRRSVAELLAQVNAALADDGVELFALNGYRPLALQQELWDFFMARCDEVIDKPTDADRIAFAGRYCSDPRHYDPADPTSWPTHITGGAIDLTLRATQSGEPLYMGGIFDDPDALSHTAHFEKVLRQLGGNEHALSLSDREALKNRRLLYWAMTEAGFANYTYEWWHYDFGTQMWLADRRGGTAAAAPHSAWYGPADALRLD